MSFDSRLQAERFPRASKYHPDWVQAGASGGANPLWLTEWLAEKLNLQPGMRVLDLGCGRGLSSIFLHREFGVQVWATDLWFNASENWQRIQAADVAAGVFPLSADARSLPFCDEFFDAIVAIDSFMYYGTDDFYLNSLARFLKPGGQIGIAQSGFVTEVEDIIPDHLQEWWTAENPYSLHSVQWWRRHWERTGIVDVTLADTLTDGWKYWRDWVQRLAPENEMELETLNADQGRHLGYLRVVAERRSDVELFPHNLSFPAEYSPQPLLRQTKEAQFQTP